VIRTIGMRMEKAMFTSTRQVNTQKGIIFLMGLSLFACGYLFARRESFTTAQFRQIIRQICHGISRRELENHDGYITTHGAEIYRKYQMTGARGEAENGFPMVFEFGLPELQHGRLLDDDVMLRAFLSIASHNDDTNIVYRSSLKILEKFQSLSLAAFNQFNAENLSRVTDFCKLENISPGGSADLLAVSIFMYFVMNLSEENGPDLLKLSHEL
jgi:triphosphoribosyl-dephospho-CoA synthetase